MPSLARPRTRAGRSVRGSAITLVLAVGLVWLADRIWPLPLPKDDLARVVLALIARTAGGLARVLPPAS